MSRPFHFVLPAVFLAGALGFSGCVGTLYDETYSYHKNHFKPPQENMKGEASAEAILGSLDKKSEGSATDATGGPSAGGRCARAAARGAPRRLGRPSAARRPGRSARGTAQLTFRRH
ncbi:MAG: hypothetical protein WDN28_24040 [Chthoniobacter sp.]